MPIETLPETGPVVSLKAIYPRELQKNVFWAPISIGDSEAKDFGWLGVYPLAYLPAMVVVKKILRVA